MKSELDKLISAVLDNFCDYVEDQTSPSIALAARAMRYKFLAKHHMRAELPLGTTWYGICGELCQQPASQAAEDKSVPTHQDDPDRMEIFPGVFTSRIRLAAAVDWLLGAEPKPAPEPDPWRTYRRRCTVRMRPYVPGENDGEILRASCDIPRAGGMVASNAPFGFFYHSPEEFAAEYELVDGGKGGGLAP